MKKEEYSVAEITLSEQQLQRTNSKRMTDKAAEYRLSYKRQRRTSKAFAKTHSQATKSKRSFAKSHVTQLIDQ